MRRIPSQVPSAVSRLLQASVLPTPPTWYIPVLSHPPPQLPPHQIVQRPRANDPSLRPGQFTDVAPVPQSELERRDRIRRYKQRKNRPLKVSYEEDRVRRQFFKDFAFEALRPVSLVEGGEIDQSVRVDGEEWTSLEQRGAYPTVEDCISFVTNLRKTRQVPLSEAYAIATKEFVALRARHELATLAAEMEARHYGAEFKPDAFEREFNLEEKSLETLIPADTRTSESTNIKYRKQPRYKWSNTVSPSSIPSGGFSGGQDYVEKWRMPQPVQVEGQQTAGDLLSAIPPPGAAEIETIEDEGERDLAFLQSVLGKSRA
ncbi:hypothetical protein IAR55_002779 [Kwoniella newhampshirensis]|uniref:37S ribosomal protein S25, mitochondrial n=1 Tax=Kwoniella newhampshirensis TaxID=1651941 RepID=A0AAW0Z1F6_9TREE